MAITFDPAGVRSSPSHSERFSPMPFRKIPFQTQKTKIEKKYFVEAKQTVSTREVLAYMDLQSSDPGSAPPNMAQFLVKVKGCLPNLLSIHTSLARPLMLAGRNGTARHSLAQGYCYPTLPLICAPVALAA